MHTRPDALTLTFTLFGLGLALTAALQLLA